MKTILHKAAEPTGVVIRRLGGVLQRWPVCGEKLLLESLVTCPKHYYATYFHDTDYNAQNILILPIGIYWDGDKLYSLQRDKGAWRHHYFTQTFEELLTLFANHTRSNLRDKLKRHVRQTKHRLHGFCAADEPLHMRNERLVLCESKATGPLRVLHGTQERDYYRFDDGAYGFLPADVTVEATSDGLMRTSECCIAETYIEVVLRWDGHFAQSFVVDRHHEALVTSHWWCKDMRGIIDEHNTPLVEHLFGCDLQELVFIDGNSHNFLAANVRRKHANIVYKRSRLKAYRGRMQKQFTLKNYSEYDAVFAQALAFVNTL